jgi:hypothetical protein
MSYLDGLGHITIATTAGSQSSPHLKQYDDRSDLNGSVRWSSASEQSDPIRCPG